MCKLIILPNKKLVPKGICIYINNNLLNNSICDLLLINNINIDHFCEKVGKCTTCKVNVKEGLFFLDFISYEEKETLNKNFIFSKNIRLSCQIFIKLNNNIIIEII